MTREVMEQALQTLESSRIFVTTREKTKHPEGTEWYDSAITALREALAQPVQEPVKMVAYNCLCGRTMKFESVHGVVAPQRTWVGLTEEDFSAINQSCLTKFQAARSAESILKERNHG